MGKGDMKKSMLLTFGRACILVLLTLAAGCGSEKGKERALKKPNLLFVFTDQQSFDMLGCYGNSQIITPEIDQLAKEGVKFNHCISSSPVCTPMRGLLLSGQHGLNSGALNNDLRIVPGNGAYFGEVLRDAGYHMGYVGKWHLYGGDRYRPIPPGEYRYGFDDLFLSNNCTVDFSVENSFFWNEKGEKEKYKDWEWYAQTRQAIDFIEKTGEEPFALFLSWHPPHNWASLNGYGAPEEMLALYDPATLELRPGCKDTPEVRKMYQGYMALCTSVDKAFGWLMDALEEKGIRDETLVVFTSDHGDFLTSYNQRTHKGKPQSLSSRVPLIMRYPAKLDSRESGLLVGTLDLMPTILGLMNIPAPETCQGLDLTGPILEKKDDSVESVPMFYFGNNWRGLYTHRYTYGYSVSDNQDSGLDPDTIRNCLYDRDIDPHEMHNLYFQSDFADLKTTLHQKTLKWMKKFDDTGLEYDTILRAVMDTDEYALKNSSGAWHEGSGSTGALKGRPIDFIQTK
jgi:arylsulfatase A-like enzyme